MSSPRLCLDPSFIVIQDCGHYYSSGREFAVDPEHLGRSSTKASTSWLRTLRRGVGKGRRSCRKNSASPTIERKTWTKILDIGSAEEPLEVTESQNASMFSILGYIVYIPNREHTRVYGSIREHTRAGTIL